MLFINSYFFWFSLELFNNLNSNCTCTVLHKVRICWNKPVASCTRKYHLQFRLYIAKSNYSYKNMSPSQISLLHKHWHTYSLLFSIFRRVGSDYYPWPWIQQRGASPWEREGVLRHLPGAMRGGDGPQTSHDRTGLQGADLWEYSHHREWCHNRLYTVWGHGWLISIVKLKVTEDIILQYYDYWNSKTDKGWLRF